MKTYFKDYWKLCEETGDFYKKHWFGTIVLTVAGCVLMWTPIIAQEKKRKKEYEKMINDVLEKESEI